MITEEQYLEALSTVEKYLSQKRVGFLDEEEVSTRLMNGLRQYIYILRKKRLTYTFEKPDYESVSNITYDELSWVNITVFISFRNIGKSKIEEFKHLLAIKGIQPNSQSGLLIEQFRLDQKMREHLEKKEIQRLMKDDNLTYIDALNMVEKKRVY